MTAPAGLRTVRLDPGVRRQSGPAKPAPRLPADDILDAYARGYAAQLLSGRSLLDLVADGEAITTVQEHLRRRARREHGLCVVRYSLAGGLEADEALVENAEDRRRILAALEVHDLRTVRPESGELTRVMRGLRSLLASRAAQTWPDGTPMRFAVIVQFSEHLFPSPEVAGRTDHELVAIEALHILGRSNALREARNLLLVHTGDGRVDPLVAAALHHVVLRQPDYDEKIDFIAAARSLYPTGSFQSGLTDSDVARITARTPHRGLEAHLRSSARTGHSVTAEHLLEQKTADVVAMSGETLSILDTRRLARLTLAGRNIEHVLCILRGFAHGLLGGDPRIPANIILAGPQSSGKTDCATLVAHEARVSALAVQSPKNSLVGETERRARLLTSVLRELTPNIALADEIDGLLPLERSEFDGDSGASRAVTAQLLTALSDESRRGRSIFIATTNAPNRMTAPVRSRFTIIPVLGPLREDYPSIVVAVARSLDPSVAIDPDDVREAAYSAFDKGATPREFRTALALANLEMGSLTPATIQRAADDVLVVADRIAAEFADLLAIRACTYRPFLPWYRCHQTYPFPDHLAGIVDPASGDIDYALIDRRIADRQPRARL